MGCCVFFEGNHARQDSMEPWEEYLETGKKPTVLER